MAVSMEWLQEEQSKAWKLWKYESEFEAWDPWRRRR